MRLEYVIDMVETHGYALINSGEAEMALFLRTFMRNSEIVQISNS